MLEFLRRGDEHHRRRVGNRQDPLEGFKAVEPGHVLIECDDVDTTLLQPIEPSHPTGGMDHVEAKLGQAAVDQPRQRLVIVDIEQRGRDSGHVAVCGT